MKMNRDVKYDKRIMDIIIEKLEERHVLDHWNSYHYRIRELWVNKTLK
jgi:hypothetical protein